MIVKTRGSTYEIDPDNKRIRRLYGKAAHTPNQAEDGEWQSYLSVSGPIPGEDIKPGKGMFIVYSVAGDEETTPPKITYTSDVVEIDPDLHKAN